MRVACSTYGISVSSTVVLRRAKGFLLISSLLLTALALAPAVQAQSSAVLRGTVTDAQTGTPLPGAHVFIAQSMTGTTTNSRGHFRLDETPTGAQRLYASMMGFEPVQQEVFLRADSTYTFDIRLAPTVIESEGVTVEAARDKKWPKRVMKFARMFVGESPFAESCTLVNPEVLSFDTRWWGKFKADAREPLVIENRALGYRITYFLEEFEANDTVIRWDGEPLFEEMTPADSIQAAQWATNRRTAYYGSLQHFLTALLDDRVDEESFRVYVIPRADRYRQVSLADRYPARRRRILKQENDSTHTLNFRGRLEIIYEDEQEDEHYVRWSQEGNRRPRRHQVSHIKLNDPPVHIDANGTIVEPYGATVYGYFSYERIGDIVPVDYVPDDAMPDDAAPEAPPATPDLTLPVHVVNPHLRMPVRPDTTSPGTASRNR